MKPFFAICFAVFGAVHLWAAFARETDADAVKYPRTILGMPTARAIHFLAGIALLLFGCVFAFG